MVTFSKFAFSDANASPWLQPDIYHVRLVDLQTDDSEHTESGNVFQLNRTQPSFLMSLLRSDCSV